MQLTIGQAARRAGTTPRALRHYDRIGLFRPDAIDPLGQRWYTEDQLADLQLIVSLRALDLPLDDVRACLAASPGPDRDAVVADRLTHHRRRLIARRTRTDRAIVRLDLATKGHPMGSDVLPDVDHRALGAALFNRTWTLMEAEDRTTDDDDLMIDTAHASAFHWRQVGKPENLARSHWQLSRVYTVVERPEPARHHAERCLQLCQANGIGDWDLGFAYEAQARAAALAGDTAAAREWADRARAQAEEITTAEDRELLLGDLATIPGL